MQIIHHGGKFGVTGSCHELVISDSAAILIDCGLLQGNDDHNGRGGRTSPFIDFPLERIKGLVLTHVHIDHCGRIPHLMGAGFQGPIWCSEASALLLPLVLGDAVKVGISRDRHLIARFLESVRKAADPPPLRQVAPPGMLGRPLRFAAAPASGTHPWLGVRGGVGQSVASTGANRNHHRAKG